MPTLKVAAVNIHGEDVVIAPVSNSFLAKSDARKIEANDAILFAAHRAGLKGGLVLVWEHDGFAEFWAHHHHMKLVNHLNLRWIHKNLNAKLSW